MSAAAVMAIVLFLFFLVGVAVGVLVVIALSTRSADKTVSRPDTWPYRSGPDPDQGEPDEPPWWQQRGSS